MIGKTKLHHSNFNRNYQSHRDIEDFSISLCTLYHPTIADKSHRYFTFAAIVPEMTTQANTYTETIVALATPTGSGAIAVIRLSGTDAIAICNKVFKGKDLEVQASHSIHFGTIVDGDTIIDEVLASLFIAPKSYTKENTVEISCHGSPYIINQIIHLFIKNGARQAQAGEFTLRAFLNGQLDLSQAEAVSDLIASTSQAAHKVAMQQMRGGFSNQLKDLRQELIDFAALIELELDFSEEDVEFANREQLKQLIYRLNTVLLKLIQSFELGNVLKNGIPVVISGKPNVGKSTLLNRLLNEERAIVSDIPGTTRDTIEDEISIKGIQFRFVDTAGLRETTDKIEAIGVERAYEKIRQSSLVMYLFDPNETDVAALQAIANELSKHDAHVLLIANKVDAHDEAALKLRYADFTNIIYISAKQNLHIDHLTDALLHAVNIANLNNDELIVSNIRHVEALNNTHRALNNVLALMQQPLSGELLAFELKQSLYHLGLITGEISTDNLLDSIFTRFCIGK